MRMLLYDYFQQFYNFEFGCFLLDQSKERAYLYWELMGFPKLAMSSLPFPAVHTNLTVTKNSALSPCNAQTIVANRVTHHLGAAAPFA